MANSKQMAEKRQRELESPIDGPPRSTKRVLRLEDDFLSKTSFPTMENLSPSSHFLPSSDETLLPFHGEPAIWATNRSSLCDTLPYFHAFQGSAYHVDGVIYGYLIDRDSGCRFYIDEEVIITRIPGSYAKSNTTSRVELTKDQRSNQGSARYLEKALREKSPIAFIIGEKNMGLHRKLPHRYNVMAFFHVTDLWFEKINGHAGMKVRFEKNDLSKKSWWAVKGSPNPLPHHERDFTICPREAVCGTCEKPSAELFREGWMCLDQDCPQFWHIEGIEAPQELAYHPAFLNKREPPMTDVHYPYPLNPGLLERLIAAGTISSTNRDSWGGVVCPLCGKCVPRAFWCGWKCTWKSSEMDNPNPCKWEFFTQLSLVPLPCFTPRSSLNGVMALSPNQPSQEVQTKFGTMIIDCTSCSPYREVTYIISDVGTVTHFISNKEINERPGGPDDIYVSLQTSDLDLKRYTFSTAIGETSTAHFAQNYGMHYKYVVNVESKSFSEAPSCVMRSLGRLTWATGKVVGEETIQTSPPNELLLLGYFEGMKMKYHDDGETNLGPTIATFSVGGGSKMTLRMKAKYFHGESELNCITKDDPVLTGCRLEPQRRALKDSLDSGAITSQGYHDALKSLFSENPKKGKTMAPVAINMNLNHGDLVVMHGARLQAYFEHSVVPTKQSVLRFALTARSIQADEATVEANLDKIQFKLANDQVYDGGLEGDQNLEGIPSILKFRG